MCVPLRRPRLRMPEQAADDRQAEPAARAHGREGVAKVIDADTAQTGVLADRIPTGAQLLQRLAGYLAGKYVISRRDAIAATGADLVDELKRGRGERQTMLPALLRGSRGLDPEPRLRVELRPGGEHGLA